MIVDPGLLNHIHKRLHSGEAEEAIIVSLKNNGWDPKQIDEAFKQIKQSENLHKDPDYVYRMETGRPIRDSSVERISATQFIVGFMAIIVFTLIVFAGTTYISSLFPMSKEVRTFDFTFKLAGFLVFFFALFSLSYRRLHDLGKNGGWAWIILLPIINLLLIFYLILPGQKGDNKFGPDPRKQPLMPTLLHLQQNVG